MANRLPPKYSNEMPQNIILNCGYVLTVCLEKLLWAFAMGFCLAGKNKPAMLTQSRFIKITLKMYLPVTQPETESIRCHIKPLLPHIIHSIASIKAHRP